MKITKVLDAKAAPAKVILDRAQHIALTYEQRQQLPEQFAVGETVLEVALEAPRALEVGDVLLDDGGHFYVIEAHEEPVYVIKGDEELVTEAVVALLNRGVPVCQCESGFAVLQNAMLARLLEAVDLQYEEATLAFEPIRIPEEDGCCCGGHGHGHGHGEGCGCGGHGHHHHEHGEGCGCGGHGHHHHHEHGDGCGCGGHGHHHHEHGKDCGCGGHGHHHHHEHGEGCGCGGHGEHHHHHHHAEGECCCKKEEN